MEARAAGADLVAGDRTERGIHREPAPFGGVHPIGVFPETVLLGAETVGLEAIKHGENPRYGGCKDSTLTPDAETTSASGPQLLN